MVIEIGDLVSLGNGSKVIILDKINYLDGEFAFVDHVANDEETLLKDYAVYSITNGVMQKIVARPLLNQLLPIFEKNVTDLVKAFNSSQSE